MSTRYLIALSWLIISLVGGIFYYTWVPEAVTVDKVTGVRKAHLDRLEKLNAKADTFYYKIKYKWTVIVRSLDKDGKEHFEEKDRESIFFTVKPKLSTTDLDFMVEKKAIADIIIAGHDQVFDGRLKEKSLQIIEIVQQFCDLTFEEEIMSCYEDGKDTPDFVTKHLPIIPLH